MFTLIYSNKRLKFGNYNVGYDGAAIITYGTVSHGTITGPISAPMGSTVTLTATPDTGYELSTITVNGNAIQGNSFVVEDNLITIGATFTLVNYTISYTAATNGSVTGPATANYGDTILLTSTPASYYETEWIKANGTTVVGNTFTMPAGNVTVTSSFQPQTYTLSYTTPTGGTLTGPASARYTSSVTVTATPNSGYEYQSISVNGTTQTSKTFTMPHQNTTVAATFSSPLYASGTPTIRQSGGTSINEPTSWTNISSLPSSIDASSYNRGYKSNDESTSDLNVPLSSIWIGNDKGVWIGDHIYDDMSFSATPTTFTIESNTFLHVGDCSLCGYSTTRDLTIANGNGAVWEFGDSAATFLNLTVYGNFIIKVGDQSLNKLILNYDGIDLYFTGTMTGPGWNSEIIPVEIGSINRFNLHAANLKAMINFNKNNRSGHRLFSYSGSNTVNVTVYDVPSADQTWINNNAYWLISGNYSKISLRFE